MLEHPPVILAHSEPRSAACNSQLFAVRCGHILHVEVEFGLLTSENGLYSSLKKNIIQSQEICTPFEVTAPSPFIYNRYWNSIKSLHVVEIQDALELSQEAGYVGGKEVCCSKSSAEGCS